jgi:hypothetical protein
MSYASSHELPVIASPRSTNAARILSVMVSLVNQPQNNQTIYYNQARRTM